MQICWDITVYVFLLNLDTKNVSMSKAWLTRSSYVSDNQQMDWAIEYSVPVRIPLIDVTLIDLLIFTIFHFVYYKRGKWYIYCIGLVGGFDELINVKHFEEWLAHSILKLPATVILFNFIKTLVRVSNFTFAGFSFLGKNLRFSHFNEFVQGHISCKFCSLDD